MFRVRGLGFKVSGFKVYGFMGSPKKLANTMRRALGYTIILWGKGGVVVKQY